VQAKLEDGTNTGIALYGLDDTTFIGGPAVMTAGRLVDLRQSEAVVVDATSATDKLSHVNPRRHPNALADRRHLGTE
jgi:putative ABC transport system permease protein